MRKLSSTIILTTDYGNSLEEKYKGLKIPYYKLRKWFSLERKVFFDCESNDRELCLREIFRRSDLAAFVVYLIVKEVASGGYSLVDISFRNLGKETLEHFINRYHQQLETMTKLGLQGAGREYVDCPGHGYEEKLL
jgi:hypothetical protein